MSFTGVDENTRRSVITTRTAPKKRCGFVFWNLSVTGRVALAQQERYRAERTGEDYFRTEHALPAGAFTCRVSSAKAIPSRANGGRLLPYRARIVSGDSPLEVQFFFTLCPLPGTIKMRPLTDWVRSALPAGASRLRRRPEPALRRRPSGSRRCLRLQRSCRACRSPWLPCPGCGRC